MENEMEERGLTLVEIWRMVRKRIWLILGVSVIAAAALVLAFVFLINPYSSYYRVDFTLTYPGIDNMKYPDGAPFYYQEMISVYSLERVKASDPRFASVDVVKMREEDDITVTVSDSSSQNRYTLSVQRSYFSERELATEFLKSLAGLPVEIAKERASNVDYLLDHGVFESAGFEDRIELLSDQKLSILTRYDEWIEIFSDSYTVNGKTLKNYRSEAYVVFGDSQRNQLQSELNTFGYVTRELLSMRIAELRVERAQNEEKIRELKSVLESYKMNIAAMRTSSVQDGTQADSRATVSEAIAALIVRNVEIDAMISALTEENVAAFELRLEAEYEKLRSAATALRDVSAKLYEQESHTAFETTRAAQEGGTSSLLLGVGSFVVVFVLISAIVCAKEYSARYAEEKAGSERKSEGNKNEREDA